MRGNPRLRFLIVAVALCVLYIAHRTLTAFPGEFIIAPSDWHHYKVTPWRTSELKWHKQHVGLGGSVEFKCPDFTIAPDGITTAYVAAGESSAGGWTVSRLDGAGVPGEDPKEVRWFQQWNQQPYKCIGFGKLTAFSDRSNVAWSPDSKYMAWASIDTLFIAEIATGKVRRAPLPLDDPIGKLYEEWKVYKPTIRLPAPIKSTIKIKGRTDDERMEDAGRDIEREVQALHTAMAGFEGRTDPGIERLNRIVRQGDQRLLTQLGINPTEHIYRGDLRRLERQRESGVDATLNWSVQLACDGRSLTWTSADTIYCDNWKLKIDLRSPSSLKLAATRTPLPSEVAACPYWSPTGKMAAYRIQADVGNGPDVVHAGHLVVVDSSGRIVWRHELRNWLSIPHWSRDGKYFAVLNCESDARWNFWIFEPDTNRSWCVAVPNDLADSHLTQWYAWDWKM